MSLLATIRGTSAGTGANVTYTFPAGAIDTSAGMYNIRQHLISNNIITSPNASLHLTLNITSSTTLSTTDINLPALYIANFHPSRDRITINNNGKILGAGGSGGLGGNTGDGHPGSSGGPALQTINYCKIVNNGIIQGGSGGSGGSGGNDVNNYGNYDTGTPFLGCCPSGSYRNTGASVCLNGYSYGASNSHGGIQTCAGSCIQQNACGGGCKTDTCGWPSCSYFNSCNCCGGNQYQGVAYWVSYAYGVISVTHNTGNAGNNGTPGGGSVGSRGANNNYTGGSPGSYGLDINGYQYITYTGSSSTPTHVA